MEFIIVGAGWAGERHVGAIRVMERWGRDVRVSAVVDVDRDHLAQKALEWGIDATYSDLSSALERHPRAEGVVLGSPHHLHRGQTEIAADAGRNVLVEKPMALTLEDADAMISACERAGTTLMVAESARYSLSAKLIRDAIRDGKIGQVLSGRIHRVWKGRDTYEYPGRRAWLADPSVCGGGVWMLNGIHTMSLARMWFGEPTRIYALEVHSEKFQSTLEGTIVALVSFEGGAEITITVSAELHGYKRFSDVGIFGADGTLYSQVDTGRVEIYTEGGKEIIEPASDDIEGVGGSFVRQMQEFVAAVSEKREPATPGASERQTLAAILAGYESARTGKPVELGAR